MTPSPEDAEGGCGWRERKKLATREAIAHAALHLAMERGLDNVRVSDIATYAGVSPRTYNNYFSSREEAVCSVGADRVWRMVASLRARPPTEPLAEALEHAMLGEHDAVEPERAVLDFLVSDPTLRGQFIRATWAAYGKFAEAVAERTGRDAENDLMPGVVAAAYQTAWRVTLMFWLRNARGRPLGALLREAFSALSPVANALEEPSKDGRVMQCSPGAAGKSRGPAAARTHGSRA